MSDQGIPGGEAGLPLKDTLGPVSYTHLDVYKRQEDRQANSYGERLNCSIAACFVF